MFDTPRRSIVRRGSPLFVAEPEPVSRQHQQSSRVIKLLSPEVAKNLPFGRSPGTYAVSICLKIPYNECSVYHRRLLDNKNIRFGVNEKY